MKSKFVTYDEAKKYVSSLNIKTFREYRNWSKTDQKPVFIPSAPEKVYKDNGWVSWNEFLKPKSNKNIQVPLSEIQELFEQMKEDWLLWDEEEKGEYPIKRVFHIMKNFINKFENKQIKQNGNF